MELTLAEFSGFNLRSRLQLLQLDGVFLGSRTVGDAYEVQLYHAYGSFIEALFCKTRKEYVRVEPVPNAAILELYLQEIDIGELFEPP